MPVGRRRLTRGSRRCPPDRSCCGSPTSAQVNDKDKAEGFVPLFNGKDLSGWKHFAGKGEVWSASGGRIVCSGKGGGWLGTDRDYDNFVLRLDYKLAPAGNSGVYIRAPQTGHISRAGMEIQRARRQPPALRQDRLLPVYRRYLPCRGAMRCAGKPGGQWNAIEIRAQGRQVVVVLNGVKIVDADLDRCLRDPAVAREHTGLKRTGGRIGLQSHTDRVEFRNLRLKVLPKSSP